MRKKFTVFAICFALLISISFSGCGEEEEITYSTEKVDDVSFDMASNLEKLSKEEVNKKMGDINWRIQEDEGSVYDYDRYYNKINVYEYSKDPLFGSYQNTVLLLMQGTNSKFNTPSKFAHMLDGSLTYDEVNGFEKETIKADGNKVSIRKYKCTDDDYDHYAAIVFNGDDFCMFNYYTTFDNGLEETRKIAESIRFETKKEKTDTSKYPDAIPWEKAKEHVGQTVMIKGKVVNISRPEGVSGNPIYLDIGAAYPDKDRVTLVIWTDDWDSAPPVNLYNGNIVYVTGTIYTHDGVANIEITNTKQIEKELPY